MRKLLIYLFFASYFLFFILESAAYATENTKPNFDFSVEPVVSDKQIDDNQRYFNLRLAPNETETIYIKISNHSDIDTIYHMDVNQAYTSKNGYIEYIQPDEPVEIDPSLSYPIEEIVTYENLVSVPANSNKTVPITISMPSDEFKGIILSGIVVGKLEDGTENHSESLITNKFNYVIGLTLSERDDVVEREIILNKVYPDISFGKTSIVANLSNPKMESYGHLKYKATVINLDSNKEFISQEYDNGMEFAPNSTYKFLIDANDKALVPGNYQLMLTINDQKENTWDFREDFEITKQDSERINKAALVKKKSNRNVLFLCLGVMVGVVLIIYLRKKRVKDEH